MADNVTAPVTGETFATKDASGVHHPKGIGEFVDGSGNPVLISATNPQPVTEENSAAIETLLTDVETHLDSLADLVQARSASVDAAAPGIMAYGTRDDALSALAEAEGEAVGSKYDANGAMWVQLAGALSAAVDSIAIGASATDGCETHNTIDLDESEEEVKATAGTLYGLYVVNRDTAPVYVKLYNATAANVSVGTTTPKMTLEIPYSAASHTGMVFAFTPGIKFSTAICIAATTGLADNDTGAPGANDVTAVVFYK